MHSKCRLCDDVEVTVNFIVREFGIPPYKENKNGHDSVGKVIHWKLYETKI